MSANKKQIRAAFRNSTMERDHYCCIICGKPGYDRQGGDGHTKYNKSAKDLVALDAHHISPRELLPNGGYVKENGATLCDDGCHILAEEYLKTNSGDSKYSPVELYRKINSGLEKAIKASKRLA